MSGIHEGIHITFNQTKKRYDTFAQTKCDFGSFALKKSTREYLNVKLLKLIHTVAIRKIAVIYCV